MEQIENKIYQLLEQLNKEQSQTLTEELKNILVLQQIL